MGGIVLPILAVMLPLVRSLFLAQYRRSTIRTVHLAAAHDCVLLAAGGAKNFAGYNRRKKVLMHETIFKRLGNLLSVKSLVTLTLTVVFAVQALRGTISQDFMTVYAVVIAFYFGTQSQKVQDALEGGGNENG